MKKGIIINDSIMTLVAIIQGFAFGYISTEFITNFDPPSLSLNAVISFSAYISCYVIILKFFQTYLLAITDYQGVKINYIDVLIIFGTGIFEFFLFSSIINESYQSFFVKLAILSILSIVAYLIALKKIKSLYNEEENKEKLNEELKIQQVNILCSVIILIITISSISLQLYFNKDLATPDSIFSQTLILSTFIIIIGVIMYNNWNSYVKTVTT